MTTRHQLLARLCAQYRTPMLAPRRPLWRRFAAGYESAVRSISKTK